MVSVDLRKEVLGLIKKRALRQGADIQLASGLSSSVYINCKDLTLYGPSLQKVAAYFWNELKKEKPMPRQIGGVSIGGDPLVAAVLLAAASDNVDLEGALVRKEPKAHGASAGKAVDGMAPNGSLWLLEDVVTSGSSSLKAAEHLVKEGYRLSGLMILVDRESGGLAKLTETLKIPVRALFKLSEILS